MRPIDKGPVVTGIGRASDAKPELIKRLGSFCSYCECPGKPQDLHVEHIYPQKPHPRRSRLWRNLLLSCNTCNSYKRHYLGDGRQKRLLGRMLWPHLDNTSRAYEYDVEGTVRIASGLSGAVRAQAQALLDMAGLMRSPAVAEEYLARGIAYDGATQREDAWRTAQCAREAYADNPSPKQLSALLDTFRQTGHFSVWMAVFDSDVAIRAHLIKHAKAAHNCFGSDTRPVARGRC